MQVNVHEAKTQLSKLLELMENGETVTIARHGKPIADIVPTKRKKKGFPFGIGKKNPLRFRDESWWKPMTDAEVDDWIDGK